MAALRSHPAEFLLACLSLVACSLALEAAPVYEPFESPQTTWRVGERDCPLHVEVHRRTFDQAHSGQGCEYFRMWTGYGTRLLMVHEVDRPRVIDELIPRVWVKATRSGVQLSARVVLPRTNDPQTGTPITVQLEGDRHDTPGAWSELAIADLPTKLQRQVRILRQRFGSHIDPAEAFVDLLVLNTYTGPGTSEIWIDDLELQGYVATGSAQAIATAGPRPDHVGVRERGTAEAAVAIVSHGGIQTIDGTPFFARAVHSRGERFEVFQQLGFNTIILETPPTAEQNAEAEQRGLWLLSPPPEDASRLSDGRSFSRVLGWLLGSGLTAADSEVFVRRAAEARRAAGSTRKLMLADVSENVGVFAEHADAILLHRVPIGSSVELSESARHWQLQRAATSELTPLWTYVQTERTPTQQMQLDRLTRRSLSAPLEPEQIWLQVTHAIAGGARGIVYRSRERLDSDLSAQRRAAIERSNLFLSIVEPWIAAGTIGQTIETAGGGWQSTTIENERSRLLVVLQRAADQQFVVGETLPTAAFAVSVPGRRVTDQAYRINVDGIQPLRAGLGGQAGSLNLPDPGLAALVVLTDDPLVVSHLGRSAAETRARLSELQSGMTRQQLEQTRKTVSAMPPRLVAATQADRMLEPLEMTLRRAEQLRVAGDLTGMQRLLRSAEVPLRQARHALWQQTALEFPHPISSPLCTSFSSLPEHWQLATQLRRTAWGVNQLAGGGFEDLPHLLQTGWAQHRGSPRYVDSRVELSLDAARSGRASLKLQAWEVRAEVSYVDAWPVWITSSPVPIQAGDLFRIHGWVKIPQRLRGSDSGLLIFDSLTGQELAQRVRSTRGWQEFTLYRAAPSSGELTVVLALTGLGSIYVDDLEVRLLKN